MGTEPAAKHPYATSIACAAVVFVTGVAPKLLLTAAARRAIASLRALTGLLECALLQAGVRSGATVLTDRREATTRDRR